MNTDAIKALLNESSLTLFDIYERREGDYQVILPIHHEDGDMLDMYLQESPKGPEYIRICDFGLTLMRLSYTYEVDTPKKKKVLENIIYFNDIVNETGNLYYDCKIDKLYEGILHYSGCVKKICGMSYWDIRPRKQSISKIFQKDINDFVFSELSNFSPEANVKLNSNKLLVPSIEYDLHEVDWMLTAFDSYFLIFAVENDSTANQVAVNLLELKKSSVPYNTLVVNKDESKLSDVERKCIARNSTRKYEVPEDFKLNVNNDIIDLSKEIIK